MVLIVHMPFYAWSSPNKRKAEDEPDDSCRGDPVEKKDEEMPPIESVELCSLEVSLNESKSAWVESQLQDLESLMNDDNYLETILNIFNRIEIFKPRRSEILFLFKKYIFHVEIVCVCGVN